MYKSAYDTTPCRDHIIQKVVGPLERYYINYQTSSDSQLMMLVHPRTEEPIPNVLVLKPGPVDIPAFAHPLRIKPEGKELIVIDARNFMRMMPNGTEVITANLDYGTLRNRAIIEAAADRMGPEALLALSNIHITVFIRWISDALGRRLALTPEAQIRLTILVGIYYLTLFTDDNEVSELEERQKTQMATKLSRATYLKIEEILRVMDEVGPVGGGIHGLVKMLREYGGSARFDTMNAALLYNIMYAGSWFGSNRNELVQVAIEHPATYLGMLTMAIGERGYKDTGLGKLVKVYDKADAAKDFIHQVWHLPVH